METRKPLCVQCSGTEKFTRLLAGQPSTAGMKSGYVTLQPGEAVGVHVTHGREEAVLVLEGRAEVFCEGEKVFSAEKETLIYIPPETSHDIKNPGRDLLRYVYIVTPVMGQGPVAG